MTFVFSFFFSFTASYFFAFIYDAPKKLFIPAGLAGASGYIVHFIFIETMHMDTIYTSLIGSLTLGLISQLLSRLL